MILLNQWLAQTMCRATSAWQRLTATTKNDFLLYLKFSQIGGNVFPQYFHCFLDSTEFLFFLDEFFVHSLWKKNVRWTWKLLPQQSVKEKCLLNKKIGASDVDHKRAAAMKLLLYLTAEMVFTIVVTTVEPAGKAISFHRCVTSMYLWH